MAMTRNRCVGVSLLVAIIAYCTMMGIRQSRSPQEEKQVALVFESEDDRKDSDSPMEQNMTEASPTAATIEERNGNADAEFADTILSTFKAIGVASTSEEEKGKAKSELAKVDSEATSAADYINGGPVEINFRNTTSSFAGRSDKMVALRVQGDLRGYSLPHVSAKDNVKPQGDSLPHISAKDNVEPQADSLPQVNEKDNVKPQGDSLPHDSAKDNVKPQGDSLPHGQSAATTLIIPTQRGDWPQYGDHVDENCGFDFDEAKGTRPHNAKAAKFWDRYVDLHKMNRKHVEEGNMDKSRILVWHCREGELCGGIGDEARGLSAMLYLAVLTDRAFFVQWSKHGEDILSLFDMRSVDTSLPKQANLDHCTSIHAIDTDQPLRDYVKSDHKDVSCVKWQTNVVADALWTEEMSAGASKPFLETQQRLQETVSKTYAVGCAFNFLYSINKGYLEMLKSTQFRRPVLRDGMDSSPSSVSPVVKHGMDSSTSPVSTWDLVKHGRETMEAKPSVLSQMPVHGAATGVNTLAPLKAKYIAIHMRFGDSAFSNLGLPEGHDKKQVDAVVDCAQQLGAKLFHDDDDWYIYMATDYPGARKYALSMGVARMLEAPMDPVHIDHDQRKGRNILWSSWADQFMIGRAWGLVYLTGGQNTRMSGFASTAAQTNFIPSENVIPGDPKHGCLKWKPSGQLGVAQ